MKQSSTIPWHKLLLALLALSILVALIASSWRNNALIFCVLVLATIVMFYRSKQRRQDLVSYLLAAFLGPTMEMIIIHFGAWQYTNPSLGGIPPWLPLLWGLTGLFLMKIVGWLSPENVR